jgi:mycothiol system anti-sigma-R factor
MVWLRHRATPRWKQQGADVDCSEVQVHLYAYIDGELSAEQHIAVTQHLGDCCGCGDGVTFEVRLRQVVASRCIEHTPDELRARIRAALGLDPNGTC